MRLRCVFLISLISPLLSRARGSQALIFFDLAACETLAIRFRGEPPELRRRVLPSEPSGAIERLSASVAEQGPEMGKVLEWNAQYGEVKGKNRAAPSSLYL